MTTSRERRIIRRLMLVAAVLVTLMVAVIFWTALQDNGRGPTPRSPGPDPSSTPSARSAAP